MKQKDASSFRKTVAWLGFNETTGRLGVLPYVYVMVLTILMGNCMCFMIDQWEDLKSKVIGIKGLIMYFMCFISLFNIMFYLKNVTLLYNAIEEGTYEDIITPKQFEYKKLAEKNRNVLIKFWYYGLTGYGSLEVITPLIVLVLRIMEHGIMNVTVDMMYSGIPLYYPKNYENMWVYFILYVIKSAFCVLSTKNVYALVTPSFTGMQLIKWELRLLRQMVVEMDSIVENNKKAIKNCKDIETVSMKLFIIGFMKHHYNIYRKVNDITRGLQLTAFTNNMAYSILICTCIFRVVKIKDMGVGQEVVFGTLIFLVLYCYGMMGEKISTEDENLRIALYETTWTDKPMWFKRSLQIILTRTNRAIEIRTFGLIVLNLRTLMTAIQAVYSYYNLLNNF